MQAAQDMRALEQEMSKKRKRKRKQKQKHHLSSNQSTHEDSDLENTAQPGGRAGAAGRTLGKHFEILHGRYAAAAAAAAA